MQELDERTDQLLSGFSDTRQTLVQHVRVFRQDERRNVLTFRPKFMWFLQGKYPSDTMEKLRIEFPMVNPSMSGVYLWNIRT